MTDFYEVHGKAIDARRGRLRRGDIWQVQVREPLGPPMAFADKPLGVL